MDWQKLLQQQINWASQIVILPDNQPLVLKPSDFIATVDIQYVKDDAYVAVDIQTYNGHQIMRYVGKSQAGMQYKPRFFCFREGPPLLKVLETAIRRMPKRPAVIVVDGHGIAHPMRLGVASWLGLHLQIPTVGVAKSALLRYENPPALQRGNTAPIKLGDEVVGHVLRTQDNVKPIFVSPGHLIDLQTSSQLMLRLANKYRLPESIRRADRLARIAAKGEDVGEAIDLG